MKTTPKGQPAVIVIIWLLHITFMIIAGCRRRLAFYQANR